MLSPTMSQPRYHRRAAMLLEAGYDITVYAFKRGYYEENTYPEKIEVVNLGAIDEGKYFKRIPKLVRSVFWIRKHEKKYPKVPVIIYTFGLDMALIGHFAWSNSVPLVYEIGDVPIPLPHNTLASKILELVEKKIIDRCQMLTVTSPGFVTDYFSLLKPGIEKKTMIIENKLAREIAAKFLRPEKPQIPSKPIKIGYIGAFKYGNCIFPLIEAVSKRKGDFELHFYGEGSLKKDILTYVAKYENVFYHGSFASNQDLQKIYESVYLSYVVYDNRDPNVRMALPNKLYDGPYFGVPLVVAENTLLAERVRSFGIGFVVDPRENGFAERLLDELTPDLIAQLTTSTLNLDSNDLVEDYNEIVPKLKNIVKQG